jgi:predicted RND superfamily exporter protein
MVFPALLAALPGRIWGARPAPIAASGPLRTLGALAARRPRAILLVAATLLLAALPLCLRVRFDRSLLAQPPLMPPSRVQAELERRFGQKDGAAIAYVEVYGADPVALDDRALQRSDRWLVEAEQVERAGLLRGHQSLSSLISFEETQRARYALLASMDPAAIAARVRAALNELGFATDALDGFLSQLVAPFSPLRVRDLPAELDFLVRLHLHRGSGVTSIATLLYPIAGAREAEALTAIESAAARAGGVVTGKPIVEPILRDAAQRDLLLASLLAVAMVVVLVGLHHRRWRPTLAILLPLALAWVLFGAALSLFHIPLNLYNLLAVPLVIGYGIDDHVFLLNRFAEDDHRDIGQVLASTGRAVVVTSLATMAGFAPIAIARFPAFRLLGVSGALAVGLCLVAAFAVLPALLAVLWPPRS